jgi:hypothetical protein
MPAGIAPPGPQALERFTIGRIGPEPSRATPAPPAIPRRYGHPSYSRTSYARTSYGRSSYVRKP